MKKLLVTIAIIGLLLSTTTLSDCETFARTFADQAGRNAADALFGK